MNKTDHNRERFKTLPSKINNTKDQKNDCTDETKVEINDTDIRDQNDSTKDWDAEKSRTGRHK